MGICNSDKKHNEVLTSNELKEFNTDLINLNEVNPSICKIQIQNKTGTGFLIKLYKNNRELFCLLSNEHVIKKEYIESKETIYIYYNYEKNYKLIKLNKSERFIECNEKMDVTIVEIIKNDNIEDNYFLIPNFEKIIEGQKIFIPQFPKGKLSYSFGKIIKVTDFDLTHDAGTDFGASGSPIFLTGTTKVIGIHKQGNDTKKENYGTLILPISELLQNRKDNINFDEKGKSNRTNEVLALGNFDKKKEIRKIINVDGDYYIGQLKDGKMHGKGKLYFKNGNIKYEGDFANDKKEGTGTYFYFNRECFIFENHKKFYLEKGDCYIGQWKNDKRNGKGIIFLRDSRVKYEGDFVNNKFQGNGKYYFENGDYYVGQWVNDLQNGKGKIYDKKGNIIYEGDFMNDHLDGNGKIYFSDGGYFIGQFMKGKIHGEGKIYDKKGNVLYLCLFFNGKFMGGERKINQDYIGQIYKSKMYSKSGID